MPKPRSKGRGNETSIRTNLDFEPTIGKLRKIGDIQVDCDEVKTPGIAHVDWRGGVKGVSANIGRNGGVDIHWATSWDFPDFIELLASNAVTQDSKPFRYEIRKQYLGRTFYKDEAPIIAAAETALTIAQELLRNGVSPRLVEKACWYSVFPPTLNPEERAQLLNEVKANSTTSIETRKYVLPRSQAGPVLTALFKEQSKALQLPS